jgi:hypothetical protein
MRRGSDIKDQMNDIDEAGGRVAREVRRYWRHASRDSTNPDLRDTS